MLKSGLVSISFRNFDAGKILDMCAKAGVDCIEWGGDKHVVHGDTALASKVAKMSSDAGIKIASYGSYYAAATSEMSQDNPLSFTAVLDSALALGTDTIRVWAGSKQKKPEFSEDRRREIVDDLLRIGEMAAAHNLKLGLEFHGGTLTESNESAIRLKDELAAAPNIFFYWQPAVFYDDSQCLEGIRALAPRISNIHTFQWARDAEGKTFRQSLGQGRERWTGFLREIAADGNLHAAMLEFIPDDSEENFYTEAAVLKEIIATV